MRQEGAWNSCARARAAPREQETGQGQITASAPSTSLPALAFLGSDITVHGAETTLERKTESQKGQGTWRGLAAQPVGVSSWLKDYTLPGGERVQLVRGARCQVVQERHRLT